MNPVVGFLVLFTLATTFQACQCVTEFRVASYILTQKAFDDAPTRYAYFIQSAIDYIQAQEWPRLSDYHGCHAKWSIDGPSAQKRLSIEPGSLKATIIENGVNVAATIDANVRVIAFLKGCKHILFKCRCKRVCNGWVELNTKIVTSTNFIFSRDPNTGGIIVNSQPSINIPNPALPSGCHVPGWLHWFVNVNKMITNAFQDATNNAVQALTQQVTLPQMYSPCTGVYVWYKIENLVFTPSQFIVMELNATLTAEVKTPSGLVNQTFTPDEQDASMAPPNTWQITNSTLHLLYGLRVSSTVLTAVMWAGDVIGAFNYTKNVTSLDAEIGFSTQWSTPLVGIPEDNKLSLSIASGAIYANCLNKTCSFSNRTCNNVMLDIAFKNLEGNGSVNYTTCEGSPGFVIQVNTFNVDKANVSVVEPRIFYFKDITEMVSKEVILNAVPYMNEYLITNAFRLPSQYQPYLPNPKLQLHHQDGCCLNTHGFIDMSTWCQCGNNLTIPWSKCNFACSESVKKKFEVPQEAQTEASKEKNHSNRSLQVSIYSSDGCSMDQAGDTIDSITLTSTEQFPHTCQEIPNSFNETSYYSLTYHQGRTSIRLFCHDTCENCEFSNDSVEEYVCYQTFLFQPANSIPCLGHSKGSQSLVWQTFNGTDSCEVGYETSVINIGKANVGCVSYGNDSFGFTECTKAHLGPTIYCNVSWECVSCQKSSCQFAKEIELNRCINLTDHERVSSRIQFLNRGICPVKKIYSWVWKMVVTIAAIFLFIAGLAIIIRKRNQLPRVPKEKAKHLLVSCSEKAVQILKSASLAITEAITTILTKLCGWTAWFVGSFSLSNPIMNCADTWILLVPAMACTVFTVIWYFYDPFALFSAENFQNFGFPPEIVGYTADQKIFYPWNYLGLRLLIASSAALWLLFIGRCTFNFQATEEWKKVVCFSMLVIALVPILVFLGIPFFFKFRASIEIQHSEDNFITKNANLRRDLSTLFGFSFCGISLTYLAHIYAILIMAISHGLAMGCALFVMFCSDIQESVRAYIRIQQAFVAMTFPVTTALPVIILYQSFGVSKEWFIVWGISWVLFALGYWHLRTIIDLQRHPRLNRHRVGIHLLLHSLFLVVSAYIIFYIESASTSLAITTAVVLLIYMTIIWAFLNVAYLRMLASLQADFPNPNAGQLVAPGQDNARRFPLLDWLFEWREHENPWALGFRASYRRVSMILGTLALQYVVGRIAYFALHFTPKERLVSFLHSVHIQMTWPSGGTIFDDAFNQFQNAEWSKVAFLGVTTLLCVAAVWIDSKVRNRTGLMLSARMLQCATVFLFVSILVVGFPNYLTATHVDKIFPQCGPNFDKMVNLICGDIVGIGYGFLCTLSMGPILLTVPIALLRSINWILRSQHANLLGNEQMEVMRILFVQVAFFSPIITVFPILVGFQILGDETVGILLVLFFFAPFCISLFAKIQQPIWVYWVWLFVYLGSLISIVSYEVVKYQFGPSVLHLLKTPEFWAEVVAEIALGIVILGDVLIDNLFIDPNHYQPVADE